jgi:hypothetical protein
MLGVEYLMAFIKIAFQVAFAIVTAIPMRIAWNCVASNYLLNKIPLELTNIPYWRFVAILLVFTLVGDLIKKLTPKIIEINQNNKGE